MAYLTDGFVPKWFVKEKPRGLALAKRLVDAGLWVPGTNKDETGWWFHDWKPECTKVRIEEAREGARLRKQRSRTNHRDEYQPSRVTERVTGRVTDAGRHAGVLGYPAQPSPTQPNNSLVTLSGGVTSVDAHNPQPPPTRCPKHTNETGPIPACRGCADARHTHDTWTQTQTHAATQQALNERNTRIQNATAKAAAIHDCPHCDQDGYRLPQCRTVCDHTDRTETNRNGITKARAALNGHTKTQTPHA